MKIIHYSHIIGGGGRERRMVQLIKGLDQYDEFEQYVITNTREIGYKEIFDTKAKILFIDERDDKAKIKAETHRLLMSIHPDIVHLWDSQPRDINPFLKFKNSIGYKLIAGFVADGNMHPYFSKGNIGHQYAFFKSDAIVSNSHAGLKAKYANYKKTHVIPNGFDFSRFSKTVNKQELRESLSINTELVVIMCARFHEMKDWNTYLEVAELAKGVLDATFLAVGGGEKLEYYKSLAKTRDLTNVIFTGQRSDIENLLKGSDISLLLSSPCHNEGISNTIMESMATGLPVIATNCGGTPELIRHNKEGYLVKVCDAQSVFRYLCDLTDIKLRTQVGGAGKERIQKEFLLSTMTERYIQLYRNILQK